MSEPARQSEQLTEGVARPPLAGVPRTEDVPDLSSEAGWTRAVDAAVPASLLVVIASRLGSLEREFSAEDILQESLLRAWRCRVSLRWQGYRAFRSWLLTICDHVIADARDRAHAAKRGGGRVSGFEFLQNEPAGSTTPSRIASFREHAELMRSALADLPDDLREVVRLRIFEQIELLEIAERVRLPLSTVQHRVRRGAALYQTRLRSLLALSSIAAPTPGVVSVPKG